jgi:hypothetical protein
MGVSIPVRAFMARADCPRHEQRDSVAFATEFIGLTLTAMALSWVTRGMGA